MKSEKSVKYHERKGNKRPVYSFLYSQNMFINYISDWNKLELSDTCISQKKAIVFREKV